MCTCVCVCVCEGNKRDRHEGEHGVGERNLDRLVCAVDDGERRARRLQVRHKRARRRNAKQTGVQEHQHARLHEEARNVDPLDHHHLWQREGKSSRGGKKKRGRSISHRMKGKEKDCFQETP